MAFAGLEREFFEALDVSWDDDVRGSGVCGRAVRSGEIVIAMIDGEATVKRFFPEGDRIRFQPGNSRMEPIFVDKKSFRQTDILGVVVGVYRKV